MISSESLFSRTQHPPGGKFPPGRRPRSGTVLLIVGIIMVILFLTASGLFRYMTMQRGQSVRQGESRITNSIAQGLAILAFQKISQEELANPSSPLARNLGKPIDQMTDYSQPVILEEGGTNLSAISQPLLQPLRELGQNTLSMRLEIRRKDFERIGPADGVYQREKSGFLHLFIEIRYRKLNAPPGVETVENFHYTTGVKIAASIVPTLSKFTLYVENAQGGDPWRFNKVSNNGDGGSPSPKPLILDNGNAGDLSIPNSLNAIVRKPIGLVYLGGGPIYLNLSRGWGSPAEGEGFHLFEFGKNDGLYTTEWKGQMALMNYDQGMCTGGGSGKDWIDLVKGCPNDRYAQSSSLLRLLGTDSQKSPTLVLGQVFRGILCARAYKSIETNPPPPGYLPFITDPGLWDQLTTVREDQASDSNSLKPFIDAVDELKNITDKSAQLALYQEKYASNLLTSQPLNLSLAFIGTLNRDPFPAKTHFGGDSEMISLIRSEPAPTAEQTSAVPADHRILPKGTDLRSLEAFLPGIDVPGSRTAWSIPNSEQGSPMEKLARRGLLFNDGRSLNCNGWIYFEGATDLTIDKNIELVSNGGIVLEQGNIAINAPIQSKGKTLYLVTRQGNIQVGNFLGDVEASLIANGKVTFGSGGIKGSVAMKEMDPGSIPSGGKIHYPPVLSKLPGQITDEDAQALLGFSLDPSPLLLP